VLQLRQQDRDRLVALRLVAEHELSVSAAARRCRLSPRHFRRLLRRYELEGDTAVVHRSRGRRPNNAKGAEVRERALQKGREPMYVDFGPTLLSEHLAREGLEVHPATLRLWMIEEGLWRSKRQGVRHRQRRERRRARGELVLMDTSIHAWLEGRSSEESVLIALIDDATSDLFCRFFPRDTGAANRNLLVAYLERHGRMGAVYADQASHFRVNWKRSKKKAADEDPGLTLIQQALSGLEIELIHALSPQAKGRVERLFGTLQDRLVKEMRVAGVASMDAANEFLEEQFIPFWKDRFTVEAVEEMDAHRPLPEGVELAALFAETEERVLRPDFTFRYRNIHYQVTAEEAEPGMVGTKVVVERRLDGTTYFRWRGSYITPQALPGRPARAEEPQAKSKAAAMQKPRPLSGAAGKPVPASHPWRQFPLRVGKGRRAPVVASAPAALRPDAPAA